MLRAIGVALLALVALSVLRTRERTHRTRSVAWLAASVAAFLLTSMSGADRIFGAFIYPLTALCSTHPVWFWICARLLFSDRATLRTSDVICLGAMGVAGVLYQSQLPADSSDRGARARCCLRGVESCVCVPRAADRVLRDGGRSGSRDAGNCASGSCRSSRSTWPRSSSRRPSCSSRDARRRRALVLLNLVVIDVVAALALVDVRAAAGRELDRRSRYAAGGRAQPAGAKRARSPEPPLRGRTPVCARSR